MIILKFLFLFLFLFNASCPKQGVKSVYLGTIKIQNTPALSDLISYPHIDFIQESFNKGIVLNFQSVDLEYPISTDLTSLSKDITKNVISYQEGLILSTNYLYFKNNLNYLELSDKVKKQLLDQVSSEYWIELNLKTSLWQQRIWGKARVYDSLGKLFHSFSINETFSHTILDTNSPHLSTLDNLLNIPSENDFQKEIQLIYMNLGQQVAQKIKKNFYDKERRKKIKKEQKKIKKYYKNLQKTTIDIHTHPITQEEERAVQLPLTPEDGLEEERAIQLPLTPENGPIASEPSKQKILEDSQINSQEDTTLQEDAITDEPLNQKKIKNPMEDKL